MSNVERMSPCPHCGSPISTARKVLTPAQIRCSACGGLSRVQTPKAVLVVYLICIIPALALLAWSRTQNHMQVFWLLGLAILLAAITLPAFGSLVPRVPVTLASAIQELRSMRWSRGFIAILVAIVVLAVAVALYAKLHLPGFWR